ncbi:hypothetical protein QR98_0079960 [Sarcoptes scabiei]|uniref:Uncharacterized protein n=1 Tax=Sarcoptes scabiei TaxID=52283 RepID=A0A132AG90_SARSC|nr:hypothetical protein QR98_0079960 [Sarcoptes scabiei]
MLHMPSPRNPHKLHLLCPGYRTPIKCVSTPRLEISLKLPISAPRLQNTCILCLLFPSYRNPLNCMYYTLATELPYTASL